MMRFILAISGLLAGLQVAIAGPTLTSLFPVGGQRGTTFTLTATGTLEKWPVKVWVNSPELKITPTETKGQLRVEASPKMRPGIYWLRLYDDTGASELRPILIGLHPDQLEAEPNDEPAKLQAINGPRSIHGKFNKAGDVDCFAIEAKQGQTLVASLDANYLLKSPVDAVLQIVSPSNQIFAENHDHHGLDPQIAFTVPSNGIYIVRAFAFPSMPDSSIRHFGSDAAAYRLTITTGPWVEFVTPFTMPSTQADSYRLHGWNLQEARWKPKDPIEAIPDWNLPTTMNQAQYPSYDFTESVGKEPLKPPFCATGKLLSREASIAIEAVKGTPLQLSIQSATLGFPLNPVLSIHDATGKQLSRTEAAGLHTDAEAAFTPPATGTYLLKIRDLANRTGPRMVYLLTVAPQQPKLTATTTSDRLSLIPGQPLDVTINLNKLRFTDDLEFNITGLDAQTTAKLLPPSGKVDPKQMVIRLESKSQSFSGPLQINLKSQKTPGISCLVTAVVKDLETSTANLWLTITPVKSTPKNAAAPRKTHATWAGLLGRF